MNQTSEPVFPWLCVLTELPLDHKCLRDCLEQPLKKHINTSSLCWACLDVHCLYVLNCLPGCWMLLLNCLEWHFPPPLSHFEAKMPCIFGSQLPMWEHCHIDWRGETDHFGLGSVFPVVEMCWAKYNVYFSMPFHHSLRWCLCLNLCETHWSPQWGSIIMDECEWCALGFCDGRWDRRPSIFSGWALEWLIEVDYKNKACQVVFK